MVLPCQLVLVYTLMQGSVLIGSDAKRKKYAIMLDLIKSKTADYIRT